MKKIIIVFFVLIIILLCFTFTCKASADDLSDTINKQMENLDLSGLEDYYSNILCENDSIKDIILSMLKGEFSFDYNNISQFVINSFFSKIKTLIAPILTVIAICVFLSFLVGIKSSFLNNGLYESVFLACFAAIVLIITSTFIGVYFDVKNSIENLTKLSEIMSPIILTLMVSSGAKVSASIFKPSVLFLSDGVMQIISSFILPLIGVNVAFCIISFFSKEIKLKKFTDFFGSIIKWVFGIVITVYSVFLTVNGIGSVTFDGISFKAAKYVISNSVPIVGGFLKDGFDIVVAGSILIKNSVGLAVIILIFNTVISSVAIIAAFSILLNFTASITESFSDERVSAFSSLIIKNLSFLLASILIVALMFFITVLFMIFSANGVL